MLEKERLIGKNQDGNYYVKSKAFDSEHSAIQRALERLYAYEETGLEPREIENLKFEFEIQRKALHKIASGELKNLKSLERLVERTAPKEG